MTDHQPLLQVSTPIRHGETPQVVLRLDTDQDVQKAIALINQTTELLAPLAVGLADALERAIQGEAHVTGQLQSAGLNPVPVAAPQVPVYQQPTVTSTFTPPPAPAQPVYQPQAQASQAYAPPAQQAPIRQAATTPLVGPCWAASDRKMHNSECTDCHQPTFLTVKDLRNGKRVNAHVCSVNPGHKVTWCENLIWNSKVVQANGQGIITHPDLVTG